MKIKTRSVCVFVLLLCVFNSCVWLDAITEDVDVSLYPPGKIVVENNSYVSTLRHFEVEVLRDGKSVYAFQKDCLIPSGCLESFAVNGFEIMQGDTAKISGIDLAWDM